MLGGGELAAVAATPWWPRGGGGQAGRGKRTFARAKPDEPRAEIADALVLAMLADAPAQGEPEQGAAMAADVADALAKAGQSGITAQARLGASAVRQVLGGA